MSYQANSNNTAGVAREQKQSPKPLVVPNPAKSSPGPAYTSVSASASTEYEECRSIYVGNTGNVSITGSGDVVVTFENVPQGTTLPVRATMWSGSASQVNFLY